jgi:hypothetical protein
VSWFRSTAFLARKKPKKHGLVEEAERLQVLDVLGLLTEADRRTLREWQPWTHPDVLLVRGRRGALDPYWHFRCVCGRRVEALYRPAGARDWQCRTCHSLIYASHRHPNPRHPSRGPLPYRTKRRRQREAMRQLPVAERDRRALQKASRHRDRPTPPAKLVQPLAPEKTDADAQVAELEAQIAALQAQLEAAKIATTERRVDEMRRRQLDDERRAIRSGRLWAFAAERRSWPRRDALDAAARQQLRLHQALRRLAGI